MNPDWRTRYDLAVDAAQRPATSPATIYETTFDGRTEGGQKPRSQSPIANAEATHPRHGVKHFPGDGFLGEEYGDQPGTTGFRWIIDPIDGTKSFVRHIPIWAHARRPRIQGRTDRRRRLHAGLRQTYRALRGDGAYHERPPDSRLGCRRHCRNRCSAIPASLVRKSGQARRHFSNSRPHTERQRGFGDFYGFVLVAEGSAEIMVDHGVHAWDVAATKAIVEEAGGTFTDWSGTPTIHRPDVLASNGRSTPKRWRSFNRQ